MNTVFLLFSVTHFDSLGHLTTFNYILCLSTFSVDIESPLSVYRGCWGEPFGRTNAFFCAGKGRPKSMGLK